MSIILTQISPIYDANWKIRKINNKIEKKKFYESHIIIIMEF